MLWPLHWLRLFTRTSDFTANPVLGSTRLNGMGLHVWRKRLAHAICESRRKRLRAGLPEAAAEELGRQGFVQLDRFLPEADFQAVKAELASAALPVIEMAQPPALTRRINLDEQSCEGRYPALLRLITNQTLLGLVRYSAGYAGAPVIAIQCIHSGADQAGQGRDPQTDWHSDTFHSTAKAWLFLHDVEAQDGPLAYIPASHTPTPERLEWEREQSMAATGHANRLHAKGSFRVAPDELQRMGYGAPYVAAVKGNTLVVADTSGFHRRTPSPRPTVRVEVYLSLRRNPFFAGLYPGLLALPVIRKKWAGWAFGWYEMLLRQGRPDWIPTDRRGLNSEEVSTLR
ncbi:MAG: phytanoyl-CoA dioxygenase family protein [Ramlibacter sp.]